MYNKKALQNDCNIILHFISCNKIFGIVVNFMNWLLLNESKTRVGAVV